MTTNCNHPNQPVAECKAIHPSNPECDCRWCVFNKQYKQARGRESEILSDIINP